LLANLLLRVDAMSARILIRLADRRRGVARADLAKIAKIGQIRRIAARAAVRAARQPYRASFERKGSLVRHATVVLDPVEKREWHLRKVSIRRWACRELERVLGTLEPTDRKVLCMKWGVLGERKSTIPQIAKAIGKSPRTVKRSHRSSMQLLDILAGIL